MNSYKPDEMSMRECARITLIIIVALMLCSCRSTRYVPVEIIKTDTLYIAKLKVDSVYHRDSVHVETKGDSITIYKEKYITKIEQLHDTIKVYSVDTVKIVIPQNTESSIGKSFNYTRLLFIILAIFTLISIAKKYR